MSDVAELKKELEKLKAENEALKAQRGGLSMTVMKKKIFEKIGHHGGASGRWSNTVSRDDLAAIHDFVMGRKI